MKMKKIIYLLSFIFFLEFVFMCISVYASDVTLAWDPNEEPEVVGYNIYWKNLNFEDYKFCCEIMEQDFDNPLFPEMTIWGLSDILTYYFVATAWSDTDESAFSNEVVWIAPQSDPDPDPDPDIGSNSPSGGNSPCFISTLK